MNKLFFKLFFIFVASCSLGNLVAMDAADSAPDSKKSAEKEKNEKLDNDILLVSFFNFKNDQEKKEYSDDFMQELDRIYKIFTDTKKLVTQDLESFFLDRLKKNFVVINPDDYCARNTDGIKIISEEMQAVLDALKEIAFQAPRLKKSLEKIILENGHDKAAPEITRGMRDFFVKELDKAFEKIKADQPINLKKINELEELVKQVPLPQQQPQENTLKVPLVPVQKNAGSASKSKNTVKPKEPVMRSAQPAQDVPKSWTSGWKGHVLTACVASAATVAIAYAVFKGSRYKLVPFTA